MAPSPVFVGIDVAKDEVVIALAPTGEQWASPTVAAALETVVARLTTHAPALIVREATGGLEAPLVALLTDAGLPVVVVNPRQARDFARARGRLAKTDAIDAAVLALFAERVRPAVRPLPDAAAQALGALLARRRQVPSNRRMELAMRGPSGRFRVRLRAALCSSCGACRRQSLQAQCAFRDRPSASR